MIVLFFVLGAIAGSFMVATVWRLRTNQLLVDNQKTGEYQNLVIKHQLGQKASKDYSRCLDCGHRLRWYDLIPIFSWLSLGGKCRYCHHKIGYIEFLSEIITGFVFVASFLWFNLDSVGLGLWLGIIIVAGILWIYDYRWMVMPTQVLYLLIVWALLFFGWQFYQQNFALPMLFNTFGAIFVLAGIYGLLWLFSKGKWVGSGDIYLGLAMGLILADWRLAIICLFLANLIGTLIVLPMLIIKKTKTDTRIPLGPLLIIGLIITFSVRQLIINYFSFY